MEVLDDTAAPMESSSSSQQQQQQHPSWTSLVHHHLKNTFRIEQFRDHQEAIINATMSGQDVFVIMRTGGGKSLTYQLPALLEGRGPSAKITFVISPLLSLIQDQEEQMNQFAPNSATSFTSGLKGGTSEHARRWGLIRDAQAGMCLVFVTPEKVDKSGKFKSELQNLYNQGRLGRFVIDEAHCVSQWGHDFRPDYLRIGELRRALGVQTTAFTATADAETREEIVERLFAGLGGVLWGALTALYRNRLPDVIIMFLVILGISVPSFVVAALAQLLLDGLELLAQGLGTVLEVLQFLGVVLEQE